MKVRLPIAVVMLFLLILILPFFVSQVESGTSTNTLYAHAETTTIGGVNYYLHKLSSANGPSIILNGSAATTGRKLMGRWVYPLSGIISIPASTWTITYRAMKSSSASSVVAHGDIDLLIRKSDNTIRTTLATDVANSPTLTLTNTWQTLTGTYSWTAYTIVSQTDYLEVAYYIHVTTSQTSKSVKLLVDDSTLALADQTKVANVMFTYPNQAPVASFTYSPSNPLIYDTVTFDASASYDPDGSIVSYKWDFGDGSITTVTNPIITHVYTKAASTVNYTVTLTVTDNEGSTGFTTQIVSVTNPSILYVSLPAGTHIGPDPDNWLSQCWLLNITGLSGTFSVRINNTHASYVSCNTHLIISLNNASYNYLGSLTVDSTTISQTSFTYGKPQPYGFTLTWENDVYPTWFSDTYVVGDINPKSYKDLTVSVTLSNTTGVRMHFDAYGSTDPVPPPPTSKGHVTDNPHEKDSTVLFWSPLNTPPIAYNQTITTAEDTPKDITLTASDPDGDLLTYYIETGPSHGSLSGSPPNVTYAPNLNYNGADSFTFKAYDGQAYSNVATVTITVNPVNDPPVVSDIPNVTFPEDGSDNSIDLDNYVSDVDNTDAEMTWTFTGNVNIIVSIDSGTRVVTFTAPTNWFGQETITFRATDPGGLWDENATTVTVTPVNDPPVASNLAISPTSPVTEDDLVGSYDYYDLEGDLESGTEIRWYKDSVLQSAYNDMLIIPSSATAKGEEWYFTVKPKDGMDFGDLETSPTVVIGNSPPEASNLAINPSSPYTTDDLVGSYTYYDVDGDLESGSEIRWYKDDVLQSAFNDLLTVPSSATAKGQVWYFTVKPKDGTSFGALQTSPSVTIQNSSPTAPVVDVTPDFPLTTDDLVCIIVTPSIDPDGDPVTYTYEWYNNDILQPAYTTDTVPASATTVGDVWKCVVTPHGSDGPPDEDQVTIQNSPPVLAYIGPKSVNELATLSFTATATDPDVPPQTLTFFLGPSAPPSASITSGGYFTWTPTEAQGPCVYNINITVSDGIATDYEVITVTVNEVNLPPVLNPIGPKTINEGALLQFTITASDPDLPAQTLTYSASNLPSGATFNPSTRVFSWTPTSGQAGVYSGVHFEVTDGALTDSEDITITVTVSRPPAPVGGYSISLTKQTPTSHITVYAMLIALFGAVLTLTKHKRK